MIGMNALSPIHEMRALRGADQNFHIETVWTADGHVFRKLEVLTIGDGWIRVQENGHHSDRPSRVFWLNVANLVSLEVVKTK